MADFQVEWAIDQEADSAKEAAEFALATQRDPASIATVFIVTDRATGLQTMVDLDEQSARILEPDGLGPDADDLNWARDDLGEAASVEQVWEVAERRAAERVREWQADRSVAPEK